MLYTLALLSFVSVAASTNVAGGVATSAQLNHAKASARRLEDNSKPPRVVQYYAQWATYGRNFQPMDMDLSSITHLHYGFFDVTADCKVATLDNYADYEKVFPELGMNWSPHSEKHGLISAFNILKRSHPHLHLAFSLGGWTKSTHFSGCAKETTKRATLVQSTVDLLVSSGWDGIDVDWEYPVCCGVSSNEVDPTDWDNYLLLLSEMRAAFDRQFPTSHKELTIAMGMSPSVTGVAPKAELGRILDAVNLMTYDYNGGWSKLTAHNAPVYDDPAYEAAGGATNFNIKWGVQAWL